MCKEILSFLNKEEYNSEKSEVYLLKIKNKIAEISELIQSKIGNTAKINI